MTSREAWRRSAEVARTPRPSSTSTPSRGRSASPIRTPASTRTPGSTSSALTSLAANVVMAVVEGRNMAQGELGVVSMDMSDQIIKISQFSDSQCYVKLLNKLDLEAPAIMLLPDTMCPSKGAPPSLLYQTISDNSRCQISNVRRRYFNDVMGGDYVKSLCHPEYLQTIQLQLQNKYYALSALSALVKYCEFMQKVEFSPASLKLVYVGCDNIMFIDSRTARYLELVEGLVDSEGDRTLYGVLNQTRTYSGMRLLRSNILQPPFDKATISERQCAVSELVAPGCEQALNGLRSILARWTDVERVISLFVHKPCSETQKTMEFRLNQFLSLRQIVESFPSFQQALSRCKSPLFEACQALLDDSSICELKEMLDQVFHENITNFRGRESPIMSKILAVRDDSHTDLITCREKHEYVMEDIRNCITNLASEHNLPLRLSYNSVRGYHIHLPASACSSSTSSSSSNSTSFGSGLPAEFIKTKRFGSFIHCTTNYMITLSGRAKDAEVDMLMVINQTLVCLADKMRPLVVCLYKLTESVAMTDMLLSLAEASLAGDYVRPVFENMTRLKMLKHPVLDHFEPQSVVANDVFAGPASNFSLITGPNMSGKSTYLRQIALVQIMAQIGCFVPAKTATMRLADRLLARLDTNDDIDTNMSSFMLEVREMSNILASITPNSLVIVDEFGRATNPEEGFGIAFAVAEELLMSKAFTFFATHFVDLGLLASMYPNVETFCFELEKLPNAPEGRCVITHNLRSGIVNTEHYGLRFIETTRMPKEIVGEARLHANRLEALRRRQRRLTEQTSMADPDFAKLRLFTLLYRVASGVDLEAESDLNFNAIRQRLEQLKIDFAHVL